MIFALAGNQNCGKTTLFNALTGSNQHVGNFPGVTVDQKMGEIRGMKDCSVVDLPGIYSLRPYTQEEIVSRDFILNQKPDGIINIVDATNIERNLYLTLQLLELQVPMVLALNMMDEVRANGGTVDVKKMSAALGDPRGAHQRRQGRGRLRAGQTGCGGPPGAGSPRCGTSAPRAPRSTAASTRWSI
jgi:ferrous iron transport protein B